MLYTPKDLAEDPWIWRTVPAILGLSYGKKVSNLNNGWQTMDIELEDGVMSAEVEVGFANSGYALLTQFRGDPAGVMCATSDLYILFLPNMRAPMENVIMFNTPTLLQAITKCEKKSFKGKDYAFLDYDSGIKIAQWAIRINVEESLRM